VISAKARDFSFLHSIQTGSEAHLSSFLMGTRSSFLGEKQSRYETYDSPLM
jgi:hypothetical protein